MEKQQAQKPQRENIVVQLSKLGNTPYECVDVDFVPADFNFFIPSSKLADMRRQLIQKLMSEGADPVIKDHQEVSPEHHAKAPMRYISIGMEYKRFPYLYNISNRNASLFYQKQGMEHPVKAYECGGNAPITHSPLLMQCRHCLKYSLGCCERNGGKRSPWREPYYLSLPDGKRFRLEFRCDECQMNVYGM